MLTSFLFSRHCARILTKAKVCKIDLSSTSATLPPSALFFLAFSKPEAPRACDEERACL